MSAFKNSDDFNERLSTPAKARQAALEKFRARPMADGAAVVEQQAAREVETARLEPEADRQAAAEVARSPGIGVRPPLKPRGAAWDDGGEGAIDE